MGSLIIAAVLAVVIALVWPRQQRQARRRYLAQFDFAQLLDTRLAARRPELTPRQRQEVFTGLSDWFQINQAAPRRKLSMPSQAVDDAWHEFILFTHNYQRFCREALGRFLHHVPAEAMHSPTQAQDGLKRSWRLACEHEGLNPRAPSRLPRLFALDAALGIAGGFTYHLDCLAAGAAGQMGYCAGHISCASGCGSDSGSSSDGGDGGSSCGSGCGGGCGGD